jgi:hypothetical protein
MWGHYVHHSRNLSILSGLANLNHNWNKFDEMYKYLPKDRYQRTTSCARLFRNTYICEKDSFLMKVNRTTSNIRLATRSKTPGSVGTFQGQASPTSYWFVQLSPSYSYIYASIFWHHAPHPEYGGSKVLRNFGILQRHYTASKPKIL